jgi:hypothetical protein
MGTRRSPALNLARLAVTSPMVATRTASEIWSVRDAVAGGFVRLRHDADLRPFEAGGGRDVHEAGDLPHLGLELRHGARRGSSSVPMIDDGELALAAVVDVPGADVGDLAEACGEVACWICFCVLSRFVLCTRRTMTAARRTSRVPSRVGAADDEDGFDLGDLLADQLGEASVRDRACRRAVGARRQFHRDDEAGLVVWE